MLIYLKTNLFEALLLAVYFPGIIAGGRYEVQNWGVKE